MSSNDTLLDCIVIGGVSGSCIISSLLNAALLIFRRDVSDG